MRLEERKSCGKCNGSEIRAKQKTTEKRGEDERDIPIKRNRYGGGNGEGKKERERDKVCRSERVKWRGIKKREKRK